LRSPGRQRLIRKPVPQVFDEAHPLIVSGENDKGLEPEPDEPTEDDLEFPARPTDTDKSSRSTHRRVGPVGHQYRLNILLHVGYLSRGKNPFVLLHNT